MPKVHCLHAIGLWSFVPKALSFTSFYSSTLDVIWIHTCAYVCIGCKSRAERTLLHARKLRGNCHTKEDGLSSFALLHIRDHPTDNPVREIQPQALCKTSLWAKHGKNPSLKITKSICDNSFLSGQHSKFVFGEVKFLQILLNECLFLTHGDFYGIRKRKLLSAIWL